MFLPSLFFIGILHTQFWYLQMLCREESVNQNQFHCNVIFQQTGTLIFFVFQSVK